MSFHQRKDQGAINKYFLDFVSKINGSARVVRADRGVENCIIGGISIVKGIKITVSYLEDLQQIKELKRGGVI